MESTETVAVVEPKDAADELDDVKKHTTANTEDGGEQNNEQNGANKDSERTIDESGDSFITNTEDRSTKEGTNKTIEEKLKDIVTEVDNLVVNEKLFQLNIGVNDKETEGNSESSGKQSDAADNAIKVKTYAGHSGDSGDHCKANPSDTECTIKQIKGDNTSELELSDVDMEYNYVLLDNETLLPSSQGSMTKESSNNSGITEETQEDLVNRCEDKLGANLDLQREESELADHGEVVRQNKPYAACKFDKRKPDSIYADKDGKDMTGEQAKCAYCIEVDSEKGNNDLVQSTDARSSEKEIGTSVDLSGKNELEKEETSESELLEEVQVKEDGSEDVKVDLEMLDRKFKVYIHCI